MSRPFHPHRDLIHSSLIGQLAAGASVLTGVAARAVANFAGGVRARIRLKATVAGTLDLKYLRPAQPSPFPTDLSTLLVYDVNPAQVAVTANVEAVMDMDLYGEQGGVVVFTPSGNGTITWADVCVT